MCACHCSTATATAGVTVKVEPGPVAALVDEQLSGAEDVGVGDHTVLAGNTIELSFSSRRSAQGYNIWAIGRCGGVCLECLECFCTRASTLYQSP